MGPAWPSDGERHQPIHKGRVRRTRRGLRVASVTATLAAMTDASRSYRRRAAWIAALVVFVAATAGAVVLARWLRPDPVSAQCSRAGVSGINSGGQTCEQALRRLDAALDARLKRALPPSATLWNNIVGVVGPADAGQWFTPSIGEAGRITFDASLNIRDRDRSDGLHVGVARYDSAPTQAQCPFGDMVDEAKNKGIVGIRCDRTVDAQGNVVLTNEENYPYGGPEFAGILVPSRAVTVYRTDGVMVSVSLQGGLKSPPAPGFVTGPLFAMLTSDQLLAIALDPALTIAA